MGQRRALELQTAAWRLDLVRQVPFALVHLAPLAAFFLPVRAADWVLCIALYIVRMLAVTIGYHRYFSHRTFKTSRVFQFLLAFVAQTSAQKGVLWWAAHHRHHHRHSDTAQDIHTPKAGFWWSHVGWIAVDKYDATDLSAVKDLARYPELVWLNKHHLVPSVLLGLAVFLVGGPSALLIGFMLSTVLLFHGTFCVNSLAHVWGSRRYATTDTSRNNLVLALLTCGEGWHNNHHHFPASANQGFFWWEVDVSFYVIRALELLRVVRDVRRPSAAALVRGRLDVPTPALAPPGTQPLLERPRFIVPVRSA